MPPKKPKKEEKTAVDESFQSVDISTREPRTVILMLSSPEPAVVVKALQALHLYMKKSEQSCKEMAELGVVPRLVELLSSPVKAVRSYAALSLSVMTSSADVRRQVCAVDGLSSLLSLLKPEEEAVTVEQAAAIVSHMATEYSTKIKLLNLSAHQLLLPLMTGADPNTQKHALTAVCQLVELHQARCSVGEEGGMDSLLSLLSSEYPPVQQLALEALVFCMSDSVCRAKLREANGLSTLVSFIGNKDVSELHLLAATVLSLCLHDAENMTALQTSGSLELLLSHVSETAANTDMKRCAATALARAARDEVNCRILHEQFVEKTFIQLLSHSDGGVVSAALKGLTAMCALSSGRARVGQEGGVVGVVSCVGREEDEVRAAAAQCLAHISADSPANCQLIQEAEGCPALVQLLADEQASCRSGAAITISYMAPSPLIREELTAAEVVPALVSCLAFSDITVQRSAADALAVMGTDSAARAQFHSSGGVAASVPLLSSSDPSLMTSALCLVRSMAQSTAVAQEICGAGALQLLTQLSKKSHAPSAVGPALQQLLNSDLSAKWWTCGHLDPIDSITDIEFFDPGPALAGAQEFLSLNSLLSHPLHMNRPIITANLLFTKAPPTSAETTPTPAVVPEQPSPSQTRSKSRSNAKSRKGQEVDSKVSNSSRDDQLQSDQSDCSSERETGRNLLAPDQGLQAHISHTLTHITRLPTLTEQAQALADYVCNSMGGHIETAGNMTFELPQSELQKGAESNVIAIGNITMGTYRHRSLLYKILADQVGLPCTLTRGDYGRQWNEVTIATDTPRCYVVDLMTSGSRLLGVGSPEAEQYCHI